MKQLTKDFLISAWIGLVLPGVLLNFAAAVWNDARAESVREPEEATVSSVPVSLPVLFRRSEGNSVREDMDRYLVGVVLAEMPALFEGEALKAQAVVARTYAWKAGITGGKHGDGSVCGEPSCCQGYLSEETYLQQGGSPQDVEKIRSAVQATSGEILTFEGQPIEATYFSCSGGRTEDAAAVWGRDFPYLQAVDSPGEEQADHYRDEMEFSISELEKRLGVSLGEVPVEQISYTEGGGVRSAVIGEREFSGTQLRSLLGLKSTAFAVERQGETVVFQTKGYGHRVGMSQYGADAMAVAGSTYEDILTHYYSGTELTRLS